MEYNFKMKCFPGEDPRINVTKDFISDNNLKLISLDEIIKLLDQEDFLGFIKEVVILFLPWDKAKKYYNISYIKKVEKGEINHNFIESVEEAAQDFLDYMVFAWTKANNERSISSSRSITKLATLMKILNRPDVSKILEDEFLYSPYGKPALIEACKMLSIKYPKYLEK